MEDRLWSIVCMVVPSCKPRPRQHYSDREIHLVMLWAALHDRPIVTVHTPKSSFGVVWPSK